MRTRFVNHVDTLDDMAERSFSISRRFVSFVVTRSQLVDKLQVLVRLAVQLEIGFVRRLLGAPSAQVVAADREQSLVLPLRAGQPIRQRRRKTKSLHTRHWTIDSGSGSIVSGFRPGSASADDGPSPGLSRQSLGRSLGRRFCRGQFQAGQWGRTGRWSPYCHSTETGSDEGKNWRCWFWPALVLWALLLLQPVPAAGRCSDACPTACGC